MVTVIDRNCKPLIATGTMTQFFLRIPEPFCSYDGGWANNAEDMSEHEVLGTLIVIQ